MLISLIMLIGAIPAAGGLVYRNGLWQGMNFKVGSKYLMVMEGGILNL